jgi:secreted trypsin-like serine protease
MLVLACEAELHSGSGLAGCPRESSSTWAVVNGTRSPGSFSLSQVQTLAVVAVLVGSESSVCSGVLVDSEIVLTAAHCLAAADRDGSAAGPLASVVFGASVNHAFARLDVVTGEAHPDLDVAVLRLGADSCVADQAQPIALSSLAMDDSWAGVDIEVAGFGWTDGIAPQLGERYFATEAIVAVEPDHLLVESRTGGSGACLGDSGGPALAMVDGEPHVLGTLDDGDPSCVGRDRYVRADRLSTWLSEVRETLGR